MSTISIFASFEFDKDQELKNNFYEQAKELTRHRVRNCSLNEAYPDEKWRRKARAAIQECDVVVVLIGEDTHNAPGVIVETDIARSLGKPIIQVRPQGRPYKGLSRFGAPIAGKWKAINTKLDAIASKGR